MYLADPYTVLALHEARIRDAERSRQPFSPSPRPALPSIAARVRRLWARISARSFATDGDALANPCA